VEKINLDEKFALFSEHWRPKVIASVNGQELKLIKVEGQFPWHHHESADELFLVWKGNFRVDFRISQSIWDPENVSWFRMGSSIERLLKTKPRFCVSNLAAS
jgi:hypothetical protein